MSTPLKNQRTCAQGHSYVKSSECPTCPTCEKAKKPDTGFLSLLFAPARRALENEGIHSLEQFAQYTELQILSLHGIGKTAIPILRQALQEQGLNFKNAASLPQKEGMTMTPEKPTYLSIDHYIAAFPADVQTKLHNIRKVIQEAAPDAKETISYQMPTFTLHGNLVHFAAYAKHIGFYPAASGVRAFQEQLSAYKWAKGSVQFPLDEMVPVKLIREIVLYRVEENRKKAEQRKMGKKPSGGK